MITTNVTRVHVRSGCSPTAQSKPLVEGEDNESGQDRKGSAADSDDSVSEDGWSVSEEIASEIGTPEAEVAAPITSGRGPLPTSSTRSTQYGFP